MNETQENKVEETSNENEFVVEVDENQEPTKKWSYNYFNNSLH